MTKKYSLYIFNWKEKTGPRGQNQTGCRMLTRDRDGASIKLWLAPCRCAGQLFTHLPPRKSWKRLKSDRLLYPSGPSLTQ